MKRIVLTGFVLLTGITQAQVKKKTQTKQNSKPEKEWINPVKLTKKERNKPYMDEVLKTRDVLTPEEAERRRKNIAIGNPFKDRGYYPKIATLSKGKYLEFHDKDSIVGIGSIRYNRKTKDIVEFREIDLSDPDAQPYLDTAGRWFNPDPLSEEFSSWSPYSYAFNNPMNFTDPTGMAPVGVLNDYKLNQNGQVELIRKTNDSSDTLFATDKKGNVDTSKSVTVNKPNAGSGSVISDLAGGGIPDSTQRFDNANAKAFPLGVNRARTANATDAANVFFFAANNSNVEWGLAGYNTGNNMTYALWTGHSTDMTPDSILFQGFSKLSFEMHSHPGSTTIPSPVNGMTEGDYGAAAWIDYKFQQNKQTLPRHFMYSKQGRHLWEYTYYSETSSRFYPGKPSINKPMPVRGNVNLKNLKK